jgi:two-component system LytT family response regulator
LRRHAARIRWVRAADNYVELHLDGRILTLRVTMREAAAILGPFGFVRIHRSYIVSRGQVDARVGTSVRMKDGAELPVGQAYSANLTR